jgi:hypothetical protein
MSRSNPTESKSSHPASIWIEYKEGQFQYYDKEKSNEDGSTGGNVIIGKTISFLFIDQMFSLNGFHSASHSFIASNEVRDTRTDVMKAWTLKDNLQLFQGTWDDIKNAAKAHNIRFGVNLYALAKVNGHYIPCAIKIHGGAYGAWNDFLASLGGVSPERLAELKKNDKRAPYSAVEKGIQAVEKGAVSVVGSEEKKNGAVKFMVPVFKFHEKVSEEANAAAIAFDKELQEFLNSLPVEAVQAATPSPAPQAQAPTQAPAPKQTPQQQAPPMPTEEDLTAMYGEDPVAGGIDLGDDSLPF